MARGFAIREPWLDAILSLDKDEENRKQDLTGGYRGEVLLLASKGCTKAEYDHAVVWMAGRGLGRPKAYDKLSLGGYVGRARITNVVRTDAMGHAWPARGACARCGDDVAFKKCPRAGRWAFDGQYQIMLADREPFGFIVPAKGALQLYQVDDALFEQAYAMAEAIHKGGGDPLAHRQDFDKVWATKPAVARRARA